MMTNSEICIDTATELDYERRHGGILPAVLRSLAVLASQ